jgi:hypothetical protein
VVGLLFTPRFMLAEESTTRIASPVRDFGSRATKLMASESLLATEGARQLGRVSRGCKVRIILCGRGPRY